MKISVYYDKVRFRLKNWRKTKDIIDKVIRNEGKISGDLYFIITNDGTLRRMNVEFLNHDYFTDVISFDYSEGNIINGEVYVSIDTVKRNSEWYNVKLNEEVNRVMVHGILHLLGYDDKTKNEKEKMHYLENKWLEQM